MLKSFTFAYSGTRPNLAAVCMCACRFPGLKTALDYIQSALQAEVALATGQDYGSFATLNGVPLGAQFITAQDVTAGARRGYGQSCLAEPNALYDVSAAPMPAGRWRKHPIPGL